MCRDPFPLPLDEGTGPVCSWARLATYPGMFFKPLKVPEANSRLSITLWMSACLSPPPAFNSPHLMGGAKKTLKKTNSRLG